MYLILYKPENINILIAHPKNSKQLTLLFLLAINKKNQFYLSDTIYLIA